MTQTMSGPNDWLQFYNQNLTPSTADFTVASTATTTTSVATTSLSWDMPNLSPSNSAHLSPEGRVAKPTRRRSRASRRTPTTLLNTDTTNFRAMVQQFTGGPSALPFAPNPTSAPQVLPDLMGFGFPSRPVPSPSPTTLVMSSPPISYHHLLQQQQQQQQQHTFQTHDQQYNMYSGGGENMFFQRLSNNNPISPPATNNVVVSNDRDGVVNMDQGSFFPRTS